LTYNNRYSIFYQKEETETTAEGTKATEITQPLNNETTDHHKFDSQNITEQIDTKQDITNPSTKCRMSNTAICIEGNVTLKDSKKQFKKF